MHTYVEGQRGGRERATARALVQLRASLWWSKVYALVQLQADEAATLLAHWVKAQILNLHMACVHRAAPRLLMMLCTVMTVIGYRRLALGPSRHLSLLRSIVPPASLQEQFEKDTGLLLRLQPDGAGLEIACAGTKSEALFDKPFCIDFISYGALQRQQSASRELVVRALGKTRLDCVIDLTAGLGRDALMMAASGKVSQVVMVERNAVMYHLLADALCRLAGSNAALAARISLHYLDAAAPDFAARLPAPPALPLNPTEFANANTGPSLLRQVAVYLDPMYPAGSVGRKSLVKKESQVLHLVVDRDCTDERANNAALFCSARKLATARIIVKRPLTADPIDVGCAPHEAIRGSTQRFDVYFANRL